MKVLILLVISALAGCSSKADKAKAAAELASQQAVQELKDKIDTLEKQTNYHPKPMTDEERAAVKAKLAALQEQRLELEAKIAAAKAAAK